MKTQDKYPSRINNSMTRRRWSNQFDRRSSNHVFGMNTVWFFNNASGHEAEPGRERTNQQKKVRPTPKNANEKKREIKQVWRKKE